MNTRLARILTLLIAAASLLLGFNVFFRNRDHASGPASPYTVTVREMSYEPGREPRETGTSITAFRADGSMALVIEPWHAAGEEAVRTRTVNFSNGLDVRLNDGLRLKSTRRHESGPRRSPATHCAYSVESFAGDEELAGYRTAKVVRGGRTSWYALDAGCAPVREIMDWGDGKRNEKTLLSLSLGEPDAGLFDVPESFQEVPPSQLMGRMELSQRPKALVRADEDYSRQRP